MKIQYASDLHLEFTDNRYELEDTKLEPKAEILLLAGDIMPLNMLNHLTSFIDYISESFKTVYWIPGNHEYYGFDVDKFDIPLFKEVRSNVFLINNHVIEIEDVNIICSTMWTHISPANELVIPGRLNDFHKITNNGKRLTVADYNKMHETDLNFIKVAIEQNKGKKNVIMTHHVPSFINYPEHYKGDALNQAFAVELHDFIEGSDANYWIYGHHHSNIPAFKIGNTTLLTNQMGYVRGNENETFRLDAVLEI